VWRPEVPCDEHTRMPTKNHAAGPGRALLEEVVEPEAAEALSRTEPHDELDALRGILLGCVIGACLWLLIAVWVL
jgi:hypothetical protein